MSADLCFLVAAVVHVAVLVYLAKSFLEWLDGPPRQSWRLEEFRATPDQAVVKDVRELVRETRPSEDARCCGAVSLCEP